MYEGSEQRNGESESCFSFPSSRHFHSTRFLASYSTMDLANTSDAQYNAQYASNEVPSPFLPSPFAAPLALPQPSDLYGAKLKVTLDHVKREIGVVREGLEGVMQVRDEVESVRRETGILKQLVETQSESSPLRAMRIT